MRSVYSSVLSLVGIAAAAAVQAESGNLVPPRTWVDKDTGHRVWRMSNEPDSGGLYFNINAYTPGGKQMVYTSPAGIHVLDLATRSSKLLVANSADQSQGPLRVLVVGSKTGSVFYTQTDPATKSATLFKADTQTGAVRKLLELPPNRTIASINADETLAAGTYIEGDATGKEYGSNLPPEKKAALPQTGKAEGPHYQPLGKGEMMELRLKARLPLVLFTLRLEPGPNGEKAGEEKILLHSTDWVNHLLFSPTNPELLMYCHEGPWHKVDRVWTIRTDGTHNTLVHKRTMAMEIAGHEFWGLDGETIWYDWQYPRGEDFFLAGYNLKTGERTAFHMQRDDWSIHFNLTRDLDLFCGDGGDPKQVAHAQNGQWIELFHPERAKMQEGTLNGPDFWQPGVFRPEHLVNMASHNYRQEPNVRFSPDKKMIFFTVNILGPSYVFGVEVERAVDPKPGEVLSTPGLSRKYKSAVTAETPAAR